MKLKIFDSKDSKNPDPITQTETDPKNRFGASTDMCYLPYWILYITAVPVSIE